VTISIHQASRIHETTQRGCARQAMGAAGRLVQLVDDAVEVTADQAKAVMGKERPQVLLKEVSLT
jgi:hypothetical protein